MIGGVDLSVNLVIGTTFSIRHSMIAVFSADMSILLIIYPEVLYRIGAYTCSHHFEKYFTARNIDAHW